MYPHKVHAPNVAVKPYGGMEPARGLPTMEEGDCECQYCKTFVKGKKDLMQHMAFHIRLWRGKGGLSSVSLFCGHTNGAWRLHMAKTISTNAHWHRAPGSCAHHCFRKVSMAALAKQIEHNVPLQCVAPGCTRWESRYNMPGHPLVDDTHKNFPFTKQHRALWEVDEE